MEWLNAPTATVVAAIIAATIALAASVISLAGVLISAGIAKRNGMITARTAQQVKHADFRQNWINKLRDEMATFQAKAFVNVNEASRSVEVGEAMLKILMLIDRKDPHYGELKQLLYGVMNYAKERDLRVQNPQGGDLPTLPDNPLTADHAKFVQVCQDILKNEWEVTKKGLYSLESYFDEAQEIETLGKAGRFRFGRAPKPKPKAAAPDQASVSTTAADDPPTSAPTPPPPADPQ